MKNIKGNPFSSGNLSFVDEDQTPIQKFKLDETSQDLSLSETAAKALDKSSSNLKVSDTNKTKFKNSLQISTIDAGHNAGRSYYFQAQSADQCDEIVRSLQRLSKSARKRAEARSLFRRLQVRRQYVLLGKSRRTRAVSYTHLTLPTKRIV